MKAERTAAADVEMLHGSKKIVSMCVQQIAADLLAASPKRRRWCIGRPAPAAFIERGSDHDDDDENDRCDGMEFLKQSDTTPLSKQTSKTDQFKLLVGIHELIS